MPTSTVLIVYPDYNHVVMSCIRDMPVINMVSDSPSHSLIALPSDPHLPVHDQCTRFLLIAKNTQSPTSVAFDMIDTIDTISPPVSSVIILAAVNSPYLKLNRIYTIAPDHTNIPSTVSINSPFLLALHALLSVPNTPTASIHYGIHVVSVRKHTGLINGDDEDDQLAKNLLLEKIQSSNFCTRVQSHVTDSKSLTVKDIMLQHGHNMSVLDAADTDSLAQSDAIALYI